MLNVPELIIALVRLYPCSLGHWQLGAGRLRYCRRGARPRASAAPGGLEPRHARRHHPAVQEGECGCGFGGWKREWDKGTLKLGFSGFFRGFQEKVLAWIKSHYFRVLLGSN